MKTIVQYRPDAQQHPVPAIDQVFIDPLSTAGQMHAAGAVAAVGGFKDRVI